MITTSGTGNEQSGMRETSLAEADVSVEQAHDQERLRAIVQEHYAFVWRSLRRLGVSPADAEDAAQEVFVTVARRLDDIQRGRERGFLFKSAVNIAAHAHRTRLRRREVGDDGVDLAPDASPSQEELLDDARAKETFYRMLDELAIELRAVFVLYEVEQLTMTEIAVLLELPQGTVASRLRRARDEFFRLVDRRKVDLSRGDRK